MKKIILHSPAIDNAGTYRDAGAKLSVREVHGDDADAECVNQERADELLANGRAVTLAEAAVEPTETRVRK